MDQLGFRHLVGVAVLGASVCWDLPAQEDTRPDRGPDKTLVFDVDDVREVAIHQSSYWIGIVGVPVEDVLRAQLNLPEGTGLVVQSVVPDSPAAAAGLREYDILTELEGQPLRELSQLVSAIEEAKENPIQVTWIRKGKSMDGEITPAKRPQDTAWTTQPPSGSGWAAPQADSDALRLWVEKLRQNPNQAGPPMVFRFFGPGIPQDEQETTFSGSLSIQINKDNDQPARIVVGRDNETWEVTEDEIDQLPEDLRGPVRRMLGKEGNTQMFVLPEQGPGGPNFPMPMLPDAPLPPNIQKQFEQMNQRMEEMLEQIRELHSDHVEEDGVDA